MIGASNPPAECELYAAQLTGCIGRPLHVDSHRSQGCVCFTDYKNEPKLFFILYLLYRTQLKLYKGFLRPRDKKINFSILQFVLFSLYRVRNVK